MAIWWARTATTIPMEGELHPEKLAAARCCRITRRFRRSRSLTFSAREREDPRGGTRQRRSGQADAQGAEADHADRGCATAATACGSSRDGATLGPKLGALLFQLPPNLKKDLALFDAFLDAFPPHVCAAFEFRHTSWLDAEIYGRLRARNLALCVADSERLSTPVEITADYGYFRLRDEGYTPDDIARWADVIQERTSGLSDVFVYFKHEEEGKGPEFGKLLMERIGSPR